MITLLLVAGILLLHGTVGAAGGFARALAAPRRQIVASTSLSPVLDRLHPLISTTLASTLQNYDGERVYPTSADICSPPGFRL